MHRRWCLVCCVFEPDMLFITDHQILVFLLRLLSAYIRRRTSVAVTFCKVLLLGILAHNDAPRASAAR